MPCLGGYDGAEMKGAIDPGGIQVYEEGGTGAGTHHFFIQSGVFAPSFSLALFGNYPLLLRRSFMSIVA